MPDEIITLPEQSNVGTGKFRDGFWATGCEESFGMPFRIGVCQRMLPYLPLPGRRRVLFGETSSKAMGPLRIRRGPLWGAECNSSGQL